MPVVEDYRPPRVGVRRSVDDPGTEWLSRQRFTFSELVQDRALEATSTCNREPANKSVCQTAPG
jgi:hypothetical protein